MNSFPHAYDFSVDDLVENTPARVNSPAFCYLEFDKFMLLGISSLKFFIGII